MKMKKAVCFIIFVVFFVLSAVAGDYRVAWVSPTKYEGRGAWISKSTALAWAEYGNKNYSGIQHWVQKKRKFIFVPLPAKNIKNSPKGFGSK